jgi:hypothetical protein
VEASGRSLPQRSNRIFGWAYRGKPRKTWVSLFHVLTGILPAHLPNTSQKRNFFNQFGHCNKNYTCNRPWRPLGLRDVEAPKFSLDNRLTDGGEVVSLTRQPPSTTRKITGTHFCWKLSRSQGHSAAGRIRSVEVSNDLIGIEPATFRLIA